MRRWTVGAVIVAAALLVGACGGPLSSGHPLVVSAAGQVPGGLHGLRLRLWKTDAAPAAWDARTDRILYDARGSDGLWDGYAAAPDGSHVTCLTCAEPVLPGAGTATHRGIGDLSPDGSYLLVEVEKGRHPGRIGGSAAEPGKGVFDDIWLMTSDGRRAWPLVTLPDSPSDGTIWPRFDRTGTRLAWAQMYAGSDLRHPLGRWTLNTASIVWHDGRPTLTDRHTVGAGLGKFFEPYGFGPTDRTVIFASDLTVSGGLLDPPAFNSQIDTMSADLTGPVTQVSPPGPTATMFEDYNEFAFYVPGTDRVVIGRTFDSGKHGLDYWLTTDTGGPAVRLTDLNRVTAGGRTQYANVGGLAFDPRDRGCFVVGVSTTAQSSAIDAVMITGLDPDLPGVGATTHHG